MMIFSLAMRCAIISLVIHLAVFLLEPEYDHVLDINQENHNFAGCDANNNNPEPTSK